MRTLLCLVLAWLPTSALAANLIPNSSFECGAENWVCYGSLGDSAYGNDSSVSGRLTTTNSVHGNTSLMWRTRLFAQGMDLLPGSYVLTYSGMASLAGSPVLNVMCSAHPVSNATNGCSNPSVTFGTSWARYTNFITVSSNDFYSFKWYLNNPAPVVWLDAVQLETGTVASAYSPMSVIEAGLTTTNINHILNAATPNYLQLKWWNNGSSVAATSIVQVVNHENTNILAATAISTNALAAGATTINVTLPAKVGWMRATSYQPTLNNSMSELICFVRPYPASTAQNTNGLFGSHPNYGDYSVQRDREAGYTFSRDLSPAGLVRWSKLQPNGTGPFLFAETFTDYYISWFTTNGTVPLLVFTPGLDGVWPRDATNGNPVQADINAWSNYAYQVAARYSPAPSNCWIYEVGNEPHNILTPTDFSNNSSNLARFQVAAAQAVKAACPNCTVIGLCGESTLSRGWSTWTNMTTPEQALFDVLSVHLYPMNQGDANPNDAEDDLTSPGRSTLLWKQQFASTGKSIWNTEMGNQGIKGGFLGPLAMHNQIYRVYVAAPPTEAIRDYGLGQRKVTSVCRESRQVLRSLGVGFEKVFSYTSAVITDDIWSDAGYGASSMEFSGAPRQGAAACLIAANYFARNPGLGRVTNVNGGAIEAYYFTNVLGTVVALWSNDQLEHTLTVTNGDFGHFEVMANPLATNSTTIRYGRTPTYLVSGSLSTAQLKATVEYGTTNAFADVMGPNISVDQTAIGVVTNGNHFFKWTITDKNKQVWSIGSSYSPDDTNNRSRIKFYAGDTWKDWGISNHAFYPFTVTRQYNLIVEGKDFYNNTTEVIGPAFGMLEGAVTNVLNVSGTMNVGTITIVP